MASMDGLSLFAAVHELQVLVGGKIDKIQQPERDLLLLTVRSGGSNYKLLLSAHPENGRAQLTEAAFENPQNAPAFCMLLRKRLVGAKITAITQPNLDRVLCITLDTVNDLGDAAVCSLYLELMGKYSNLVFVNEAGAVVDCVRHVGVGMSSVRILLPGASYAPPPAQDKLDPRLVQATDFYQAINGAGRVNKRLSNAFFGLAPGIAELLVSRAVGKDAAYGQTMSEPEKQRLANALFAFYQDAAAGRFSSCLVHNDAGETVAVYPFVPAVPPESITRTDTLSQALDLYYKERDMQERIRRRSASLLRILQNNIERCEKKLAIFEETLHTEDRLDELCLYGELITANLHSIPKGVRYAKLMNYYKDPMEETVVPLDERLSPQENAKRYFKKYQKGKAAKVLAAKQKEETLQEIEYLEGQVDNLSKCATDAELLELRQELEAEGYSKP
ncbi:MAG: NFACT family protein, partial [Eubacteriales bacterium]|nr:NFACT family protein [Eubacteriales bacterium]